MKTVRSALVAVVVTLLVPAGASAAATIGSSLPPSTGETLECASTCTFVPTSIAGTPVVVPYDGVIVRWAARVPAGQTSAMRLRVVRPAGEGKFSPIAYDLATPGADGVISRTPARRLPVKAGDLIGVDLGTGRKIGIVSHATTDSTSSLFAPALALNAPRTPTSTDNDDFEALVNATIEADADGDGYGDETQDGCPQFAQETRPCNRRPGLVLSAGRAGIGVVEVGKQIEITASVIAPNHFVPGAVLRLTLPAALKRVAIRGTAFCTAAGNQVTCPIGDLWGRESRSVLVDALALRPAVTEVRADLTTGLPGSTSVAATTELRVTTTKRCGLAIRADGAEHGTTGGDRITGEAADDTLTGRAGDDCLIGRAGDDVLDGGDGDDSIDGGRGEDLVRGGAGGDRLEGGSSRDRFEGGPGNDVIDAADGKRDVVRCGPGRDRARVDAIDSLTGCERVARKR